MKIVAARFFNLLMIVTIPVILLLEMCLLVWLALETEEIPAEPWAWSAMVSLRSPGDHLHQLADPAI